MKDYSHHVEKLLPLGVPGCSGQNQKLLPVEFLKSWPQKLWMKSQKKPPLHEWLMRARCEDYKHRMNAIGNIVVPSMAFFAMHKIQSMWV